MIIPQQVELVLFGVVLATLVVSSMVSTRVFLFSAGFVIPLMFPRLSLGIGIDWYKVIGPLAIFLLIAAKLRGRPVMRTSVPGMRGLLVYALVVSVVWMVIEYNWLQRWRMAAAMSMGGGDAQTIYKMPVQVGSVLGQMLAAYIIPAWAVDERDARTGILGFMAGCATSVVVGLLSFAFFRMGTLNTTAEGALFVVGDTDFTRLGGMSGEPKFLGASLALATSVGLAVTLFGSRERSRNAVAWSIAVVVALFITFSTSAWVAAVAAFGVGAVVSFSRWRESRVASVVVILGLGLVIMTTSAVVGGILEQRFVERLFGATSEVAGQKDAYVLEVFRNSPWNVPFGYGLGGGDLAILPYIEWLHVKYGRTPTPAIAGVRLLIDLGVVGVGAIAWVAVAWARRLRSLGDPVGAGFALMGLAAASMCSMIGLSGYFFLIGGFLALAHLRSAEASRVPAPAPPARSYAVRPVTVTLQ